VRIVLLRQQPLLDGLRDVDDHLTAQHPVNGAGQRGDPAGLVQVPGRPGVQRLPYPLGVRVGAEHEDLGVCAGGDHLGDRLDAVVPREMPVDKAHIGLHQPDGLDGLGHAVGHRDLITTLAQHRGHRVQEHTVVVPDHQAGHRAHPVIQSARRRDWPRPA
jgi:hypothetical protein